MDTALAGGLGLPSKSGQSIKDAVAEVASPATSGAAVRPSSRGATARRRPAPKVITDSALQVTESSPSSPQHASSPGRSQQLAGAMGLSSLLGSDLRTPLPLASQKTAEASGPSVADTKEAVASAPQAEPAAPQKKEHEAAAPVAAADSTSSPAQRSPVAKKFISGMENAPNAHCTISTGGECGGEIRTKVFRMGAPLLRSTIPVSLGGGYRGGGGYGGYPRTDDGKKGQKGKGKGQEQPPLAPARDDQDGSDVETILSQSDGEEDDGLGQLSVTLDFPC